MTLLESIRERENLQKFLANGKNNKAMYCLRDWVWRNVKDFSVNEAFQCLYNACGGNIDKILAFIKQLDEERADVKGHGTPVFRSETPQKADIIRGPNGLEIKGLDSPQSEPKLKGQHGHGNQKIFRKDGEVKKNVRKSEAIINKICDILRELFPNADNQYITHAGQAIRNYGGDASKKQSYESVAQELKMGKLMLDDSGGYNNFKIVPNPNYVRPKRPRIKRKVVVNESQMRLIREAVELTEYKFYNNVNRFISELLRDPVNAELPVALKANGINKNSIIRQMISLDLIRKDNKIIDKDNEGNPKTAMMRVKYSAPKKDHNKKLKKLFIKTIGKNVPPKQSVNEDGEGGAAAGTTNCQSSGAFVQPLFGVQRRKMPIEIEETTATTNTGNYQYTVPFGGDEETLARGNGKGGSNSVYRIEEAAMEGFSYETLKSLPSFIERFQYCEKNLGENIGAGSSRIVYQINDQLCLKLAGNDKGIAQNQEEMEKANDKSVPEELVPKVFREISDTDNYTFIVAEYVLPAEEEDFLQVTGISFDYFQHFLLYIHNQTRWQKEGYVNCDLDDDEFEDILEIDAQKSGLLNRLFTYVVQYGLPLGDIIRLANWGMTKRYDKVYLVLLDNGFTDEIFNKYYR